MSLMVFGLVLWSGVHLFPSTAVGTRKNLVDKLGLGPYKGIYASIIVLSIVLIVFGWRSSDFGFIYMPPLWGKYATYILVLITFILFVAAKRKTNIKRILRHPQLTGLVLWSIGHLLANGDNRSLILFTWLGLWAVIEMIMITHREGEWTKPEIVPAKNDVITVLGGCILYAVLLIAHPYLSGISLISA